MSKHRNIVVDDRAWKYKIGRSNVVAIAVDNKEKRVANFSQVANTEWPVIEYGEWKHTFRITPVDIATWIKSTN